MKILYIWDADYPWDIRVDKICTSLADMGHEVHIAARNLKKQKEYERISKLHVHRLKYWKNEKVNYVLSFPMFLSPIWKSFLERVIINNSIDLIIVRDLPMAVAGLRAGKRNGIPVILDMAENYPAMIREIWNHSKFKGLNLFVRNPYLATMVENYAINRFDHVLVVVEEAVYVVAKHGVIADKITIVSNTPVLEDFTVDNTCDTGVSGLIKGRYSAIYSGGITKNRGLPIVIEAIPHVVKQIPDFLLVVVGKGIEAEKLKQRIKEKNLEHYVLWLGWRNHDQLYSYIKSCKIGLIPHIVSDHTNTTIPNKLFDYMGCGIPVVASNTVPMERIIKEENCGVIFNDGDYMDFARAILKVNASMADYGKNGATAVFEKYNWSIDSGRLAKVISKIQSKLTG